MRRILTNCCTTILNVYPCGESFFCHRAASPIAFVSLSHDCVLADPWMILTPMEKFVMIRVRVLELFQQCRHCWVRARSMHEWILRNGIQTEINTWAGSVIASMDANDFVHVSAPRSYTFSNYLRRATEIEIDSTKWTDELVWTSFVSSKPDQTKSKEHLLPFI